MKELYSIAEITKQALHQHRARRQESDLSKDMVIAACKKIRKNHKRMGCRRMYVMVKTKVPVGRDIFEQIGFGNGFKLKIKRNPVITTWSQKVEVHPNLLEGKVLTGINQAWQSDIFYIKIENAHYYGVTILDVYSRFLLGLNVSKSLLAVQTRAALKQAIKARNGQSIKGCIFHSDRGSQYISTEVKELVRTAKLLPSMCLLPQENAYVERVQGTLKHEYLFPFQLTEMNLQRQIKKITSYYNNHRPHSELGMLTPLMFEQKISNTVIQEHPKLKVYQWTHPLLTFPITKKKEAKKKSVNNENNS